MDNNIGRLIGESRAQTTGTGTTGSVPAADRYTDAYTLDLSNNRLAKTHTDSGGVTSKTTSLYNALDQLTSTTLDPNVATSTDALTQTDFEYDDQGNTLDTTSTTGTGPMATTTMQNDQWDDRGRLTGFDANGNDSFTDVGDSTYGYSSDGLRVSESRFVPALDEDGNPDTTQPPVAQVESFLFDPLNFTGYAQVVETRRQTGATLNAAAATKTLIQTFTLGNDVETVWSFNPTTLAASASHLVTDLHGSVRALTTTRGASTGRTETYDFDAFGVATAFTIANTTGGRTTLPQANATSPLQYSGEWWDPIVASQFLRSRWRKADASGWLSRDDITTKPGQVGDANLYGYVDSDPANKIDPTGHFLEALEVGEIAGAEGLDAAQVVFVAAARTTLQRTIVWALIGSQVASYATVGTILAVAPDVSSVPEKVLREKGLIGPKDKTGDVPIYYLPLDEFPNVGGHVYDAIHDSIDPKPFLLHRAIGISDGNRETALKGYEYLRDSINNSLDEYPFASTHEGGSGASVRAVPLVENRAQGTDLQQFYFESHIDTDGEPFIVMVVKHRGFDYGYAR